jgi:hypothetical protein
MSKYRYPRLPITALTVIVLLAVWYATLTRASAHTAQPEDKQDSVHGIVVNSVTHEPVARALVYSPDNRFATMTDGEGRFEFTFAPTETDKNNKDEESGSANVLHTTRSCVGTDCVTYTSSDRAMNRPDVLQARKPGFLNDQNGAQTLQSATPGKELTILLIPEALVVGRVTLPTSEASEAIQLEIYRRQVEEGRAHWVLGGSASTKSDGEFRFAELSAGIYKLLTREVQDRDPLTFDPRGQQYGYPPVYFPNASDFAAAQTIQLEAGQIFQADISLVRHLYYRVKVAVANVPPGVGGIGVVVSAQGHRGPGYSLGYNNQDQTIQGVLPNGNYTLEASSFGPNGASGLLNISVKGAAVEGSGMTLVPNGSISVNVKEEFTPSEDQSPQGVIVRNGQPGGNERGPRSYLNVRLEPADDFGQERGGWLRPPTGPEDDSLAIDSVQPGRYWVRANSSRGFVASVTSGEMDLLHQPLVVGPGGSSSPIEITVRDGGAEIDGTIEGAAPQFGVSEGSAGSPAGAVRLAPDGSFAHVYCIPLPDSSGEFRDLLVPPDGKFGPQEVPPGTYRVLAFDHPQPELEYRDPEAMRAYDAKGQLVRLVAGQKEHLQLQLISSSE